MLNFLASILPPDAQGKRNLVNIRDTLGMERSSERRESNAYPYNFRREQVSKDHSMRDFNTYPWNNFKRRDSLGLERSNERQVSKAFPWYNFKRGQVAIDNNERFPILQELRERAWRASRVSDRMHLPLANWVFLESHFARIKHVNMNKR